MGKDVPFLWLLILLATYIMHLRPLLLDIDECAEANAELNNCEQNCNNTVGSFECSCRQGYQPVEGAPNRCEGTETEHCCLIKVIKLFRAYSGYICHETFSFITSLLAMSIGQREVRGCPEGCKQHGHICRNDLVGTEGHFWHKWSWKRIWTPES